MDKKIYELDWILENGTLYASTAIKVMLTAPDERADIVMHWLDAALEAKETWEKHEAELHALAALLAKEQMGDRIAKQFPGFFDKKPWWIWMREQIEGDSFDLETAMDELEEDMFFLEFGDIADEFSDVEWE